MIIAMTAMTLSSCQTKEMQPDFKGEEGDIHVIVKADGVVDYSDTKTAAVEDGQATYVKWLSTDKLDIWETPLGEDATKPKAFTSGVASNLRENGMQADFSVSFGGTVTGEEFWYTAIYPVGAVEKTTSGFYRYKMPAKQKLSVDGNFSEDCDVMIGVPVHKSERVSDGSTLEYSFRRPGTVVKLRLKGIHSGETINSITINAPAYISGFTKICIIPNEEYHVGEIYDFAYSEADQISRNTLVIDGNGFVSDGDDDVWVRFNACTWHEGSSLDITVDTDEAVYTKSYVNNLPKEYKFEEGGLTKFGFSFGENDREQKSTPIEYTLVKSSDQLVDGASYIIVGRYASSKTHYYSTVKELLATKCYYESIKIFEEGSQSDALLESLTIESTTTYVPFKLKALESSKYALRNMTNEKFAGINGTSNASMTEYDDASDNNAKFTISITNDTYQASVLSVGQNGRGIYANLGSSRFSSYTGEQQSCKTYLYVDLSTVKAQLAAPSVSAVGQELATAIKVTCSPVTTDKEGNDLDGANLVYTLKVTGETEVAPITLTDADLVEGQYVRTVSGLEYGPYVVNVTVTDANDKYRSNYGEGNIELVQPELAAIEDLVATGNADEKKIELVWSDVENADTYTIKNGDSSLGSVEAGKGEYTISDITYGQEYVITVEASKEGYQASISNTQTLTVTQPKVADPQIEVEADASARTIYLIWDDVEKATKYEVYNFTEKLAEVEPNVNEYTIENVEYDVFYEISIKAINGDNVNYLPGISNTEQVSINNPAAIGVFEVTADVTNPNSLVVDWGAAENATSYTVAYYNGEDLVGSASNLEETEHTFSDVDAGTYTVKVTASAEGFEPRTESSEPVAVRNATITYATVTGGSVSSDPQGDAKVGSVVNLTNSPAEGYEFVKYTKNGVDFAETSFTIDADVEIGAVFQKINYTITKSGEYASNITIKKNGVAVETAQLGDVITIEAGSVSGKTFESWDVTGATLTSTTANPTTFTMGTSNVTVTANYKVGAIDVLTNADFVATGTQYKDFSGVTRNTAVYAGNSAKNNGIQLRATNPSGIVSTTSGGKIKTVTVKWNANCAAGRVLDVYGSNTAYTSAADLYENSTKGTKLGSITQGTSTNLTVTGNYAYVGVRSSSNALNIDEIQFEWGEGGTPTPPTPTSYNITLTQPDGGSIDAKVGGVSVSSAEAGKTVSLTVESTPSGKAFSSWTVTKAGGGTVTVSNNQFVMPEDNVTVEATFTTSGGGTTPTKGTVLWGENFAHFGTNTPSAAGTGTGTTIYDNANITYAQNDTGTKGYNETLAGGTAPELLLKSGKTWTISNIKTGGATSLSLTYKSNNIKSSVTCSTTNVSVSGSSKSYTITVPSSTTSITLVFNCTGNTRIDDVELKVN